MPSWIVDEATDEEGSGKVSPGALRRNRARCLGLRDPEAATGRGATGPPPEGAGYRNLTPRKLSKIA